MGKGTCIAFAACLGAAVAAAPGTPAASGLETSGIGARGRSMGYALAGVADDWSSLYYNPAGLARLTGQERACVYEFFTGETSSSASLRNLTVADGPDAARGDLVDPLGDEPSSFREKEVGAVVHAGEFGWTTRRDSWGYGFGIFGSGAGSSWEDRMSVTGGDILEGEVAFSNISINLPLGIAWAPSEELAVGAALGLRLGKLDAAYRKIRRGALPYRLVSEQKTRGYGAGLDLGLLWSPSPRWSLGAVWRLPALIVRDGETSVENTLAGVDIDSGTRVDERIPSRVTVGTAFRPGKGSFVAVSVTWLDWSAYCRKTEYDTQFPGILENSSGNPLHWQDAFVVNLGGEIPIGGPWTLRGGLVWDGAPEREEYRTLVGGQTLDVWKATVGLGRAAGRSSYDVGYTYTWSPDTKGYLPGEEYRVTLHEIYVGCTWRR